MKLPQRLNRFLTVRYLRWKRVKWTGEVPYIDMLRPPIFMVHERGILTIGPHTRFFTDTIRTRIRVDAHAVLTIGRGVTMNNVAWIRAEREIMIEDNVRIAPRVRIWDTNMHQ